MDNATDSVSSFQYDIRDFLTYLHTNKEFALYYYLFNDVEVITFENNQLVVSSIGSDKTQNNKLVETLFQWTSLKWSVMILDINAPVPLKERMKLKMLESKEWEMLRAKFPDIEVMDILLK